MNERRQPGRDRPGPNAPVMRLAAFALLGGAVILLCAAAPKFRAPRSAKAIQELMADGPHAADCDPCHSAHGEGATPQENLLLGPNDNNLCLDCHTDPWTNGSFAGAPLYAGSAHGAGTNNTWPGPDPPARLEPGAGGKCVNCHDPHGWTDTNGRIPLLALQREEKLCLTCHDGAPATTQVMADLLKPFRHPTTDFTGRHTGPGEIAPTDYGRSPLNRRHAECEDCHNPHVSRADAPGGPSGSDASLTTLGTSRVIPLNGISGSVPLYTFVPASDTLTGPVTEYQLCFKCHSSWTTQPSGQTDFGRVLNPANPSFHPVEDLGRNPGIAPGAFTSGWSAASLTRCGDCHGSDFGLTSGPHGSIYPGLLKAPYDPSPLERSMGSDELCFRCHSHEVYADHNAPSSVLEASRFNPPRGEEGHAEHVGKEQIPCGACHATHGSTTLPFLLVTGRNPGINSYTRTASGGTCAPTCHDSESYTVNYAR